MIPIGPYEPDIAKTTLGVTNLVVNALPNKGVNGVDWAPLAGPAAVAGAGAVPSAPYGSYVAINPSSGAYEFYVGTADSIYKMQADYTFTQIGTGYSLPTGDYWSFLSFGNFLLMTNKTDGILQYNMVTPGAITAVSGAPKARSIAVIFDCVFAFDCDGNPLLQQNSAINDHTTWTPGSNNAGYQAYPDGQELIGGIELIGGVALTFQRDRISVLTRDAQMFYTRTQLSAGIGSVGFQSIIPANDGCYFLSTDGFYYSNGGIPQPVGAERVNRTFLMDVDQSVFNLVQGTFDTKNKICWWRYKKTSDTSSTGVSGMIGIDWQLNAWTTANVVTSALVAFATPGYSLDGIDSYGTLETIPISFDARFWLGGLPFLASLDANYKINTWNGANLAATLATSVSATPRSQLVTWATPLTDVPQATTTMQIGASDILSAMESYSTAVSLTASGRAPVRGRGKNIRFRINVAAGATWSFVQGVDFVATASGGVR